MSVNLQEFKEVSPGTAREDQLFSAKDVIHGKDVEESLIKGCQLGDRKSRESLVRKFEKPVFNAAYRITGNPDDAADVTQTVFLKVFENIDRYDPKYKLFSWIYRIAVNEALDQCRRRKNTEELDDSLATDTGKPYDSSLLAEMRRELQSALMRLSDDHRAVIVMRYFTECSYREIADALELPEKTVKSRLYSARQQMRECLNGQGYPAQ